MRRAGLGLHFILGQTQHTAKCRLAQTLAGANTPLPPRQRFPVNQRSRFQCAAALRKSWKFSSSFALRAAVQGARSVQSGVAQSASQPIRTIAAFREDLEVFAGRSQRLRWSAATPRASAPQAVGNPGTTKTAASPISGACVCALSRLQSKRSFGQSPRKSATVPANPSVNRTLHGIPGFGPPFHSGPNPAIPFRAGYLKR